MGRSQKIHEVLIEAEETKKSSEEIQGRNDGNKIVILPAGDYGTGNFVRAEITAATTNVLKGRVLSVLDK